MDARNDKTDLLKKRKMVPITDFEMAVNSTFASIVSEIQLSNLNFCIQMTPFAVYITLKKSAQKGLAGNHVLPSPHLLFHLQQVQQDVSRLQKENSELKTLYEALEKSYANLGQENENLSNSKKEANHIISAFKSTQNILENNLDKANSEISKLRAEKAAHETFAKEIQTKHLKEASEFNAKIKANEKYEKNKEKENSNLKRNLENARETIQNMKSEKSLLKTAKTKLEREIKRLEKRVEKRIDTNETIVQRKGIPDKNMNTISGIASPAPQLSSRSAVAILLSPPPSMTSHLVPYNIPFQNLSSMRSHYVSLHSSFDVAPSAKSQDASENKYTNIELEKKEDGFIGPRLPRMFTDEEVKAIFDKLLGDKYK